MTCRHQEIKIYQGATYVQAWRWGSEPLVYKPVAAVTSEAPFTVTATSHGVPNNWQVAFSDLLGSLGDLNAKDWPPSDDDFHTATVVDANTLVFDDIDANRIGPYTFGGSIAYYTPVSLAGASAVLNVYTYPPVSTATPQAPFLSVAAVLDDTAKTITATLSAVQTATLTAPQYSFALVVTDGTGAVTVLDSGMLQLVPIGIGQ